LFPEIFAKPIRMEFDQRQGSSDGGAVLLKAAERRYGLIASMVDCLFDGRQASKVDHRLKDLFAQRVFSIACGYPDANDSARLAADPMHKMLLDRDPVVGLDLGPVHTTRTDVVGSEHGADEAEPEGCGGSTVEGENEVWPHVRFQPEGPGPIFPISASIVASRRPVCVTPHSLNSKNWLPEPPPW
jgi:hypothetical protein